MPLKVSIIIPVFKVEPFLEKCVWSIINQTYQNLEIILVDDGSPDKCPQICDDFANREKRIKVIHKNNEGVTKARIDGFKMATSDYIMFVDADDALEINAIEELVGCILEFQSDIVVCQANIILGEEKKIQYRTIRNGYYTKEDINKLLQSNFLYDISAHRSSFPLYLWGKLYKKKLLSDKLEKGIGFWYGEDMVTMISIIKEAKSMYISEKALYNYFQNDAQVTHKPIKHLLPQYVKVWNYFEETDKELYFKYQLPQRMWTIISLSLANNIKIENNYWEFKSLFQKISQTPIVKRLLPNKEILGLHAPTYKLLHFFLLHNLPKPYYFLVKYDLVNKFKRLIRYQKY